jgi:hypothetical protein
MTPPPDDSSAPAGAPPALGHTALGQVAVASGALCVVDFGHLRHWTPRGPAAGPAPATVPCGPVAAVTVGGVPTGNHTLFGVRAGEAERWRYIELRVGDGAPARVDELGVVPVRMARLLFADLAGVDHWRVDEPFDGLADVVFWGADAAALAAEAQAPELAGGSWGWEGLAVADARPWVDWLEAAKASRGLRMVVDYRPHDDAWRVLAGMRSSPYNAGATLLGQGFATGLGTPGDGDFPVLAIRSAEGGLIAVRVDLSGDGLARALPPAAAALPPDPMSAAGQALARGAADFAQDAARRALVRKIKSVLPRVLWPLIPGERGTVAGKVGEAAQKELSRALWGCGCSLAFFFVFGLAALGVAATVGWALLQR